MVGSATTKAAAISATGRPQTDRRVSDPSCWVEGRMAAREDQGEFVVAGEVTMTVCG